MTTKTHIRILALALALCTGFALTAPAADKKEHKHAGGPKGGRLLETKPYDAEFLVEKDCTVSINFYSEDMKPVPVGAQTVTAIADAKDGKAQLEFEKKGDSLVSKTKLPEGDGYNVVVQYRETADAKPRNFRFKLDMHTCGECKRAEYACTCDH